MPTVDGDLQSQIAKFCVSEVSEFLENLEVRELNDDLMRRIEEFHRLATGYRVDWRNEGAFIEMRKEILQTRQALLEKIEQEKARRSEADRAEAAHENSKEGVWQAKLSWIVTLGIGVVSVIVQVMLFQAQKSSTADDVAAAVTKQSKVFQQEADLRAAKYQGEISLLNEKVATLEQKISDELAKKKSKKKISRSTKVIEGVQ